MQSNGVPLSKQVWHLEDLGSGSFLCSRRMEWALGEFQHLCAEAIVCSFEVCGTGCPKRKCRMKLALEDKGAVCLLAVSFILLLKFKSRRRKQK